MDKDALRKQAEEALARQRAEVRSLSELSPDQLQKAHHELQVHQIELELQNEQLRQTQEALESSRDRYADLYDFAPVGYLTLKKNGFILEANLTAAGLLGMARRALLRRPLSHFMQRGEADRFYLCLREAGRTKPLEIQMQRDDGAAFYGQLDMVFLPNQEGTEEQCRVICGGSH